MPAAAARAAVARAMPGGTTAGDGTTEDTTPTPGGIDIGGGGGLPL